MKSLQVAFVYSNPADLAKFSDLQVLRSAAGWYIGTIHTDEKGFQEPGSRDSTYFASEEIAKKVLDKLVKMQDDIDFWESWLFNAGYDPHCVGYRYTP